MTDRRPSTFRQRDVTAAIKAARKAGERGEVRVEFVDKDGRTIIITSREPEKAGGGANPWDEALP